MIRELQFTFNGTYDYLFTKAPNGKRICAHDD